MTVCVAHDLAAAVVAILDAGSFILSIDPQGPTYDVDTALEDMDELHVDVVPGPLEMIPDSRVSVAYTASVDVAVRYRFGTDEQFADTGKVDVSEIYKYMLLTQQIAEEVAKPANRAPSSVPTAAWIGCEIRWPWVPDDMRQRRQYTGIVRATYRVAMDLA